MDGSLKVTRYSPGEDWEAELEACVSQTALR
jgi:hypothetical protein